MIPDPHQAITLPSGVKNDLRRIGLAHQSIAFTRVNSTGKVSTSVIDMTPRAGNSRNARAATRHGNPLPSSH